MRAHRARARVCARPAHRRHVPAQGRGRRHGHPRERLRRDRRVRADREETARRAKAGAQGSAGGADARGARAMAAQGSAAQERDQGRRLPAGLRQGRDRRKTRQASFGQGSVMYAKPIYVVDGARTPFLKSKNRPGPFAASDLATQAGRTLLARQKFAPDELDEVILGCASPSPDEVNIGRVVALRLGCGLKVPGWTVMRNCASGMQALDSALSNIRAGRSNLVLAGGVDALSRAPLLYSDKMVLWFANFSTAKTLGEKAGAFLKLKPTELLTPIIGIMKGLTDPMVGLMMG